MTTIANRNLDSIFNRPSSCQSSMERINVDSCAITPIFLAQSFSFVCQHHIAAHVSALLVTSSPPTIARLVIPTFVWITINAVPERWSLTHVLQKCLKRISPPCAHLNAFQTIPLVVFNETIVASLLHHAPRTVCRRVGFPVRDWTDLFKAAATCAAFTAKAAAEYSAQGAAVASAVPHGATLLIQSRIVDNSPAAKDFSSQILHTSGWNRDRIGVSHVSVPLPERNVVRAAPQFKLRCRSLLLQNKLAA